MTENVQEPLLLAPWSVLAARRLLVEAVPDPAAKLFSLDSLSMETHVLAHSGYHVHGGQLGTSHARRAFPKLPHVSMPSGKSFHCANELRKS
jgi:hypothetical protein